MTLKEQATALQSKIPAVFDAGKKNEFISFWSVLDSIDDFYHAFSGYFWSRLAKAKFKPPKDIKPRSANGIFSYWNSGPKINFKEHCDNIGIKIDFSNCTNIAAAFNQSTIITHLGTIDARKTTTLQSTFYGMINLLSIEKFMPPSSASVTFNNTFSGCYALENIIIEGSMLNTVSFQDSTKLTKNSIISIISALGEDATGKTLTLSNTAVTTAFGSPDANEWKNLSASKPNWTITLV